MPSLLELQERFAGWLEGSPHQGAAGVDVYRESCRANYRRALGATYRVVRSLMGADAFDRAVDRYVAAFPPAHGDLNIYGADFAEFLERDVSAVRAFVPDLARLEWAFDESIRAADAEAAPEAVVASLEALGDARLADARLLLHPSCRFVASRFAVYGIWSAHQEAGAVAAAGASDSGRAETLMTRRHGARGMVERIGRGEFAWLEAIGSGATFATAVESALAADRAFDLGVVLRERVHDGTIVAVD